MSKTLALVIPVVLFLRWLAAGQVVVTVAGTPVAVPVIAVAAVAMIAVTGALAALLVYRIRAEQAMMAAWQARKDAR
jgi:hypothetical protein